jgi:DNA mismatch repair protein MutL
MSKIKVLPEKVINQIAAGEVVERPSSVIKELMENSLDANATWVEVEVQEGGRKLLKVSDDGEGMSPEDAKLAVLKHATSKVYTVDDLSQLHTFGFRGEALSSIASVSHFELSTRTKGALSGTLVKIKGGDTAKISETGRPEGTTISISNLFFNTPARLKFMKKESTEENHIVSVVTNFALAFPQVAFKLTVDGKETLRVSASDFTGRVSAIFGKDLSKSLLPVNLAMNNIKVSGVVSAPTVTKSTRENMLFFVNRRWVSNPSLGYAVMAAFHTLLPTRRFPVSILFIEIPENEVDVNVHPTKKEVKFSRDREVFDVIVKAARNALLSSTGSLQPLAPAAQPTISQPGPYEAARLSSSFTNSQENQSAIGWTAATTPLNLYDKIAHNSPAQPITAGSLHTTALEDFNLTKGSGLQARRIEPETPLYNFSQLFNTFIVFQSDSEMFIADQHTVHERLNYERLMKGVREKSLEVQPLLVPATIEVSTKEAQVLKNSLDILMELGMEVAPFGGNTFLVRSVPADLSGKNVVTLMKDLLDDLASQDATGVKSTNRLDQLREKTATFMSCRSAVMAGDRLNEEQMTGMVNQMRAANLPFTCPHGRPTILSIPLSELYRRFDRH